MKPLYITGNKNKARLLSKYLNVTLEHRNINLDEIQSLNLEEVVTHKVRQAYELVKKPVLVEDTSVSFEAMGKFPGPLIKFFIEELDHDYICSLFEGRSRKAVARCNFAYYNGKDIKIIGGELHGTVAQKPSAGPNGFGWDTFFIEDGTNVTRSNLSELEYERTYKKLKAFDELKDFIGTLS